MGPKTSVSAKAGIVPSTICSSQILTPTTDGRILFQPHDTDPQLINAEYELPSRSKYMTGGAVQKANELPVNGSRPVTVDVENVRPRDVVELMWDPSKTLDSLRAVRIAAEEESQKAINWYWNSKRWKARLSRGIQLWALALTALAGIGPIGLQLLKSYRPNLLPQLDSGLIAAICVGTAAALLGLDKAFGFSSGWTRYVLTATSMTKLLHEFRMDWVALVAAAKNPTEPDEQTKLIQRAKDFISNIQNIVLQETKDWATEFQNNMAQMEKDLKSQLETLKTQVEQNAKQKEDTSKPGAIELTVANADKTDGFHFDVILESAAGKVADSVSNAKVWTKLGTSPGQYKLTIEAKVKGSFLGTSSVLDIKPAEIVKPSLELPIS
jgi:hypothetical protein